MHREQGEGVFVVFDLLAVCVGQPGESPIAHANRQIQPFNVAG